MGKNVVLLTATVTPRGDQTQLLIQDPSVRLGDYRTALAFYHRLLLDETIDGIVFAENSGFALNSLETEFPSTKIEWLGSYDLDYPNTFHRGYGEFRLIDDAMTRSSTVKQLGPRDHVWKITGRYQIKNLKRILATAPQFDLYCDSSSVWTEMSVMAWTKLGYQQRLAGVWETFATGKAPELILAERLRVLSGAEDCIQVESLAWPPLIMGRRGTDGGEFTSRWGRMKFTVRLLPFWIKQVLRGISSSHLG
jgi:hypothetical protein